VQVRETTTDTLVTAIEILSPVNKRGEGLYLYRAKRKILLRTDVHLIELDLLRGGERPGWEVKAPALVCEYMVLVNRAFCGDMRRSEIWPVALDAPLPLCPVPLLPPDADAPLALGEVLAQVYQRAAYARRIDYTLPVPPSLCVRRCSAGSPPISSRPRNPPTSETGHRMQGIPA
jgi:hypothetical protein